jgi:hypothetical protein
VSMVVPPNSCCAPNTQSFVHRKASLRIPVVKDDAVKFWVEMKPLFHTPANSVPSERSFSVRNLIQDKKRSCLSPEAADKLSYIHVNRRVLDRNPGEVRAWHEMEEEARVVWEDEVLAGVPDGPDWLGATGSIIDNFKFHHEDF